MDIRRLQRLAEGEDVGGDPTDAGSETDVPAAKKVLAGEEPADEIENENPDSDEDKLADVGPVTKSEAKAALERLVSGLKGKKERVVSEEEEDDDDKYLKLLNMAGARMLGDVKKLLKKLAAAEDKRFFPDGPTGSRQYGRITDIAMKAVELLWKEIEDEGDF